MKTLAICSGGLDFAPLAYVLANKLASFDQARVTAADWNLLKLRPHRKTVDLDNFASCHSRMS